MCLGPIPLSRREVNWILYYSLYNYKVRRRLLMERLDIFHACNLTSTEKYIGKPRYGLMENMLARQLLHFKISTDSNIPFRLQNMYCVYTGFHNSYSKPVPRFSNSHILKLSEHWYLSGANIPEYFLLTPSSAAHIKNKFLKKTKIKWTEG